MTGTVLPAVTATRYVTPLREGGSLPGLMEADDLGTYVVKWRAAGQGVRVLVAEVVCGELARALALPVPALVTVDVVPELAVGEPDPEVQELLQRSAGRNLGLDYLPGALDFEAGVGEVEPELAGRVLWFDALVGNVDRSWRNPNMLFWHGRLQLIDHGAALTFHHSWAGAPAAVARPYDAAQHALVECSPDLLAADADLAPRVTRPLLERVLAQVPDDWLEGPEPGEPPAAVRERYVSQLLARLAARDAWLPGVVAAAAAGAGGRRRSPRGENRPAWLGPPPPPGVTQR
ncbi:HipA family kinase [Geodermatophilus sp. SYSU D00684]